jgi:thiamine-phosphate pyrophosphorylase
MKDFHLYLITDSKRDVIEDVKIAIENGIKIIQLRDKVNNKETILETAKQLRELTKESNTILIINNHIDIAKEVNADGVHLGQDDTPIKEARTILNNKIIGISCHSLDQAIKAEKDGADYIGIGPIFKTQTKNYQEIGSNIITNVKNSIKIPFISIGGIDKDNIDEVLNTGATRVAIISALLNKDFINNLNYFKHKLGGM